MGIVHFIPLGKSPGAATTSLAYFKNTYGALTEDWGRSIESVVLFVPRELKEGKSGSTRTDLCIYNRYMELREKRRLEDVKVVDAFVDFLRTEIAEIMPDKGKVYWCEAFPYDFQKSFRSAAEAIILFFSRPESKGKHLWVNLTGGTNIMNAALLQVAFLSGLVGQVYYTFVDERLTPYLQPTGKGAFSFCSVPLMKTSFDEAHHALLLALKTLGGREWFSSKDLLSFLKREFGEYFEGTDQLRLEREFLTQMDGRGLERSKLPSGEKTYDVRLTTDGESLLSMIDDPLFRALVLRGQTSRLELNFTYGFEELWTKSEG